MHHLMNRLSSGRKVVLLMSRQRVPQIEEMCHLHRLRFAAQFEGVGELSQHVFAAAPLRLVEQAG